LSAGIAYYALFSLGPLAFLTMSIAGLLFETETPTPSGSLIEALDDYIGEDLAALLSNAVAQLTEPQGYTFAIVGLGILLYGATRLFVRLQASFNLMWDIRIVSRTFSVRRVLSRLLVFGMILIPTILLVVALVLTAAFSWLSDIIGGSGILIQFAQVAVPFIISWLALLTIFVVLPDIKLSWRDCWFTTLLVAIAWAVATHIFGRYLAWSGSAKYAGAVGAVIGLIFWVDIMAIITLVGVRFNKAIYLWRDKVVQPYEYAAPVTELPDVEITAPAASSAAETPSSTAPADGRPNHGSGDADSETPPGVA
jgi:membrane protein